MYNPPFDVNSQQIQTLCHCGEKGIVVALPTNNAAINLNSGYTLTVKWGPYTNAGAGAVSGTATSNVVSSPDGTQALWTLNGAEFPPPVGGIFYIDFHAVTSSYSGVWRTIVRVLDATAYP